MKSSTIFALVLVVVALASTANAHAWITSPVRRVEGYVTWESAWPAPCGKGNGLWTNKGAPNRYEIGSTVAITWSTSNHGGTGADQNIQIGVAANDAKGTPTVYTNLYNAASFDTGTATITFPSDMEAGWATLQWKWMTYYVCGDIEMFPGPFEAMMTISSAYNAASFVAALAEAGAVDPSRITVKSSAPTPATAGATDVTFVITNTADFSDLGVDATSRIFAKISAVPVDPVFEKNGVTVYSATSATESAVTAAGAQAGLATTETAKSQLMLGLIIGAVVVAVIAIAALVTVRQRRASRQGYGSAEAPNVSRAKSLAPDASPNRW